MPLLGPVEKLFGELPPPDVAPSLIASPNPIPVKAQWMELLRSLGMRQTPGNLRMRTAQRFLYERSKHAVSTRLEVV